MTDIRQSDDTATLSELESRVDQLTSAIRETEYEMRQLRSRLPSDLEAVVTSLKRQRDEQTSRRRAIDDELRVVNKQAAKQMDQVNSLAVVLKYKREDKINEAVARLEHQLQANNFSLRDEKKIVAEIDSLRRSKKVLSQYNAAKRDHDSLKQKLRNMRDERDRSAREFTRLKHSEDDLRKKENKLKQLKQDEEQLSEEKRVLQQRVTTLREAAKEAARLARETAREAARGVREAARETREDRNSLASSSHTETQRLPPFYEEVRLCSALITYLLKFITRPDDEQEVTSQATAAGDESAIPTNAPEGAVVLRPKREEFKLSDRPRGRKKSSKKRKTTLRALSHTPQTLSQFEKLNISAPTAVLDVQQSIACLEIRRDEFLALQASALQQQKSSSQPSSHHAPLVSAASLPPQMSVSADAALLRAARDQFLRHPRLSPALSPVQGGDTPEPDGLPPTHPLAALGRIQAKPKNNTAGGDNQVTDKHTNPIGQSGGDTGSEDTSTKPPHTDTALCNTDNIPAAADSSDKSLHSSNKHLITGSPTSNDKLFTSLSSGISHDTTASSNDMAADSCNSAASDNATAGSKDTAADSSNSIASDNAATSSMDTAADSWNSIASDNAAASSKDTAADSCSSIASDNATNSFKDTAVDSCNSTVSDNGTASSKDTVADSCNSTVSDNAAVSSKDTAADSCNSTVSDNATASSKDTAADSCNSIASDNATASFKDIAADSCNSTGSDNAAAICHETLADVESSNTQTLGQKFDKLKLDTISANDTEMDDAHKISLPFCDAEKMDHLLTEKLVPLNNEGETEVFV